MPHRLDQLVFHSWEWILGSCGDLGQRTISPLMTTTLRQICRHSASEDGDTLEVLPFLKMVRDVNSWFRWLVFAPWGCCAVCLGALVGPLGRWAGPLVGWSDGRGALFGSFFSSFSTKSLTWGDEGKFLSRAWRLLWWFTFLVLNSFLSASCFLAWTWGLVSALSFPLSRLLVKCFEPVSELRRMLLQMFLTLLDA